MRFSAQRTALFIPCLVAILGANTLAQMTGHAPKNGFVPNEKTAIAVAEAVLIPIYGEKQIVSERPFHASLSAKGVWTVTGSLPEGWDGGVAVVCIDRQNGRILYVMHGK